MSLYLFAFFATNQISSEGTLALHSFSLLALQRDNPSLTVRSEVLMPLSFCTLVPTQILRALSYGLFLLEMTRLYISALLVE